MPTATEVMDRVADERAPLVSITTEDGITHRLWRLGDPGEQAAIAADLSGRRALIADGHHRYAAYLQLQAEMRAAGLGTRTVGLRAGVPGRLGRLPAPAGRHPPGAARPAAGPRRRAGQGRVHRAGPAGRPLPGRRAGRGWPRPGGRDPRSCWPAARCSACSAIRTRFSWPPRCRPGPRRHGRTSPPRSCSSCCSAVCGASPTASATCSSTTTRPTRCGRSSGDATATDIAERGAGAAPAAGGTAVICNPASFEAVIGIAAQGERVPRKSTSFGPKPRTGLILRTFGPSD